MAAGVAIEGDDPNAAIDRYERAAKIDPLLFSAEVRLTRSLLLSGRITEAQAHLDTMDQNRRGRIEAALLRTIAAAVSDTPAPSTMPSLSDALSIPRPLRAIARALAASDDASMRAALGDADAAGAAVLCGDIALRSGHLRAAREAAIRALDLTPGFAPARSLAARVALSAGQLEDARKALAEASPQDNAELFALVAYEAGDERAMGAALALRAVASPSAPASVGLSRLRGDVPIAADRLLALWTTKRFWSDVIAVDAALDAGDLGIAHKIVDGWPTPESHPVHALRLARLLRYEGKWAPALAAIAKAPRTLPARIEQALIACEIPEAREGALRGIEGTATEERWTRGYILSRANQRTTARTAIRGLPSPPPGAPLLLRRVAALALGELQLASPGDPFLAALGERWGRNPDIARAIGSWRTPAASPAPRTGAPAPRPTTEDPY